MNRSTNIWSTAVAAAALFALPIAASAQTPPSTQPPAQPPMQQPPTQPPAQTTTEPAGASQAVAKQHLTAARDALSQLTSLPEAAKLQGESRTQVSGLISSFNELITTQANWRTSYDKVNANLTALLGPDTSDPAAAATAVGTSGTAGTAGTAGAAPAAASDIDPAIRAKLSDFRKHLKAFEKVAGGEQSADASSAAPPPSSAPPPPSSATGAGVAGATGTSGTMPPDPATPAESSSSADIDKHLNAISDILEKSTTGALTKAETAELKTHVAELRKLLKQPPK